MKFKTLMRTLSAEGLGSGAAPSAEAPPAEGTAVEAAPSSLLSNATDQPNATEVASGATAATPPPAEGGLEGEGGQAEGAAPEAPLLFDPSALTLPEGFEIPEEQGAALAELLNDDKISPQERGQKLVDLYQTQLSQAAEQMAAQGREAWEAVNNQWRSQVQELPEFKGRVDEELGAIKQTLVSLGADQEFFDALNVTGFGNTPAGLKMFHILTKPFREGGPVGGGLQAPRTYAPGDRLYKTQE